MITGKPYPIRALFTVGTTLFHRESDSTRLAKALKTLDLLVVQDLLPHEVCDYADYVLPATYFLERRETAGVKWALDGSVHMNDAGIRPPEGVEARHDVWILLEILRRAYPERAERVGYKGMQDGRRVRRLVEQVRRQGHRQVRQGPGSQEPGLRRKDPRRLQDQGLDHGQQEEVRRLSLEEALRHAYGQDREFTASSPSQSRATKIKPISDYFPAPAYTAPKPQSNEFVLVSGKTARPPRVSTSSPRPPASRATAPSG